MCPNQKVPIVIGVTGHRDLRAGDTETLFTMVTEALQAIRSRFPYSSLRMLNSLAEGADQLCADVALALGIPLYAALPMTFDRYETDFTGDALKRLRMLAARSEAVFVTPRTEPELPEETARTLNIREDAYRQAGLYIATHCDVLLALWNGIPHTAYGCGTAETVAAARGELFIRTADGVPQSFHLPASVVHIRVSRRQHQEQAFAPYFVSPLSGILKDFAPFVEEATE
jgi:hypothetical protein